MTRICMLGNSHIASLKNAWTKIGSTHPDYELVFFASRQEGLSALRLEGNTLIPSSEETARDIRFTSGGRSTIELDEYDAFVTYGLLLSLPSLDRRLSSAVLRRSIVDGISNTLNIRLCKTIREGSRKPVFIGHNPLRATPDPRLELRANMLDYHQLVDVVNSAIEIENASLISQPEQTIVHGWFTRGEYSRGSTRLDVGDNASNAPHPDNDYDHMNEAFGTLWLQSLFRRMGTAATPG